MIGAELSASLRAQWLNCGAKLCQVKWCMHRLLHIEARLNSNLRICQVSRREKVFTHRRFMLSLTVPMAKRNYFRKQTTSWRSWLDEALCKSSQNILRSPVCLGDLGHPLKSYFQSRSWTTRISHVEGYSLAGIYICEVLAKDVFIWSWDTQVIIATRRGEGFADVTVRLDVQTLFVRWNEETRATHGCRSGCAHRLGHLHWLPLVLNPHFLREHQYSFNRKGISTQSWWTNFI